MAERVAYPNGASGSVLNSLMVDFAEWLGETSWSIGLHESFYMFNWLETTHVLTLMLSLGMLFVIDARMLGWWLMEVPASRLADRLAKPMWIGFSIMIVTGVLLYTAIPVRYTTSIWFRIKVILLFVAAINAWTFHRHLNQSASTWDTDKIPPKRTRVAAMTSLCVWAAIVICGRFIAYDWYDCGKEMPAFMNWATGCVAVADAH
jgi:hypothetical protein